METVKKKAVKVCKEFLGGIWTTITFENLIIERLCGGMSNYLYKCSLPPDHSPWGGEPSVVLLRLYIRLLECDHNALVNESVIFTLLSEQKLGPKLYAVFDGGRLEEFIPSKPLLTCELNENSLPIAKKLAQIHAVTAPINKEPTWMFNCMDNWFQTIQQNTMFYHMKNACSQSLMEKLLSYPLHDEICWIKDLVLSCNSPVLFCHNDLQENNILVQENFTSNDDRLIFIDFEYCCYNFRGFDFGNHFCEYCFDYTYSEKPFYLADFSRFPSEEKQLEFIKAYLEEFSKVSNNNLEPAFNNQQLLQEVRCFVLFSHFFWGLWSICMSNISEIDFDYLDYALTRFTAYFESKNSWNFNTQ